MIHCNLIIQYWSREFLHREREENGEGVGEGEGDVEGEKTKQYHNKCTLIWKPNPLYRISEASTTQVCFACSRLIRPSFDSRK